MTFSFYIIIVLKKRDKKDSLLPFSRKQGMINDGQPSPRGKKDKGDKK